MAKNKNEAQKPAGNYIEYEVIYEAVEAEIQKWLENPSNLLKVQKAENEGWLGSRFLKKCQKGLFGYLKINFAIQIKTLQKFDNDFPIYNSKLVEFLRSDWFKNETLKNGYVSHRLILDKHLLLTK